MRWGRLEYAVSINWPKPRSTEGARRLLRVQQVMTNETDADFVDQLIELVTEMIEDGSFVDQLERPYFVQDLMERTVERLIRRG